MKQVTAFVLALLLLIMTADAGMLSEDEDTVEVDAAVFQDGEIAVRADALEIPAAGAILMEQSTGTVLWEKEADRQLEPASVTKIMTILLIAEAVDAGTLQPDDTIQVSAYAAGMGGSQVFLEEGEQMCVRDMLKAIVVASANDAAVAMAEHLAGTESAFVERMNRRAAELGMTNTRFCNCTGLLDQPEHVTSARDVAIMARELMTHDWIREYTTIWTDTLRDGAFGLSNTNKLIRFYDGATGLKTGFTQRAGYCLAATAERNGEAYVAVVLNCATSAERFESARTLLSFAFANYAVTAVEPEQPLPPIPVTLGEKRYVQPVTAACRGLVLERSQLVGLTRTVELAETLEAPVYAGDQVGTLRLEADGVLLTEIPLLAGEDSPRLSWGQLFLQLLQKMYIL